MVIHTKARDIRTASDNFQKFLSSSRSNGTTQYPDRLVLVHGLLTKAYPVPRTPPVKVDYLGHEYRDFEFEMNDVEVRMSCMTEFNGEHYIFGGDVGDPNTGDAAGWIYQMAKIDGCGLKKLPDLPFSFTQVSLLSESFIG